MSAHPPTAPADPSFDLLARATTLLQASETRGALASLAGLMVPALADWCLVELVGDEAADTPAVLHHADPRKVELVTNLCRLYPERRTLHDNRVLTTGQSELIVDVDGPLLTSWAQDAQHLAALRALELRSLLIVPIKVSGRVMGTLSLATAESGRHLGRHDLGLATHVANLTALALERHRHLDLARAITVERERESRLTAALQRVSSAFASELDPQKLVQLIVDEARGLTGASFGAFFWNAHDRSGANYLLYTLSGAPREAFAQFPSPRATHIFGPTFRGEGIVRLDDVTSDPRYGKNAPYHGMPEGHLPVRSYLAAPVKGSRGEVMGGLFFGHPEVGRFTADHELVLNGLCGHAAVALQNARLYDQTRSTSERLALALDAGHMGAWEFDVTAGKVTWSPRLEAIHGIPIGSFAGTFEAYQSDIHPDDREHVLAAINQVLEQRRPDHHVSYRIVRPDGEIRWLETRGRLFCHPDGRPDRLVGVCTDVTERQRAEQQLALQIQERERAEEDLREAYQTLRDSEHRYRQILDSVQDMVSCRDADLTMVYANKATCSFHGKTAAELGGLPPKHAETDRAVLSNGRPVEVLDEITRRHDGATRSFHTVKTPVFDTTDRVVEVVSVARDITERRQADQRTRQLERDAEAARQAALRAAIGEALTASGPLDDLLGRCCQTLVGHLGLHQAVVWMNDESEALVMRACSDPTSDLPQRLRKDDPLLDHLRSPHGHLTSSPGADPAFAGWNLAASLRFAGALPLRAEDRPLGLLLLLATEPVPSDSFAGLGIIADTLAQGIERKGAQELLAAHAEELRRSNAELQQFAYVASHDLQEPLRMVTSYTQLIARRYQGRLDADADAFIGYAVEGVTRMQELINDLLNYSRVGTRSRELEPTPIDRPLTEALSNLRLSLEQSGAQITHDPLPCVPADGSQLQQLFQNLIANALKFRGEPPPRVHVSARRQGDEWVFSVQDNGIGIDPSFFERVFVIFQRLHTRTEYPGNGIGLAICKKIVERHGGRIWITSAAGQGSTFWFSLPAAARRPTPAVLQGDLS